MEKPWGSNPGFHLDFKGSHSGGYLFFALPDWRTLKEGRVAGLQLTRLGRFGGIL